jgi:hypothetical protein
MSNDYEFNPAQNAVLRRLVANMWRAGVVVVIGAALFLAYHFIDYFGLSLARSPNSQLLTYVDYVVWFLLAVIAVVTGILLIRATAGFTAVVRTEGNDLGHLMTGMSRLARILGVLFWSAAVGVVLLGVSFAVLIVS